jgi:hypothetical protein
MVFCVFWASLGPLAVLAVPGRFWAVSCASWASPGSRNAALPTGVLLGRAEPTKGGNTGVHQQERNRPTREAGQRLMCCVVLSSLVGGSLPCGSWRFLEGSWRVLGGSSRVHGGSWRVPGGSWTFVEVSSLVGWLVGPLAPWLAGIGCVSRAWTFGLLVGWDWVCLARPCGFLEVPGEVS